MRPASTAWPWRRRPGHGLHDVGDDGPAFRDIGFLSAFVTTDNPTSSAVTRELLDWRPAHTALIDDLGQGATSRTPSIRRCRITPVWVRTAAELDLRGQQVLACSGHNVQLDGTRITDEGRIGAPLLLLQDLSRAARGSSS